MFSENDKLSSVQTTALFLLQCISMSVLFLPARTAAQAGNGAWVSVGIGAALAAIWAFFLWKASSCRMPFGMLLCRAFGKPLGVGIGMLFCAKLLWEAAAEARLFCEAVRQILLPRTPVTATLLLLLFLCATLAAKGIETIGRTAEILVVLVFLPLILVLVAAIWTAGSIPRGDFTAKEALSGVLPAVGSFRGLQFFLFLAPFAAKAERSRKKSVAAVLLLGGLFTVIVWLALGVYGSEEITRRIFPTLELLDRVSVSGVFMTGAEGFLLWFWLVGCVVLISSCLLFAGSFLGKMRLQKLPICYPLALIVFLAAYAVLPFTQMYLLWQKTLPWLDLVFVLILPLALWLRRKFAKREEMAP